MSRDGGYIKLYRRLQNHRFWTQTRRFSKLEAWLDLMMEAAWSDHKAIVQGRKIMVRRGEVPHSVRTLAGRWGWGIATVSRFISDLKAEQEAEQRTEQGITLLRLVNYETYQGRDEKPEQKPERKREQRRNSGGTAAEQTEEGKEEETPPKAPHGGAGEDSGDGETAGAEAQRHKGPEADLPPAARRAVAACGLDFEQEAGRLAGELGLGPIPARKKLLACCLYAARQAEQGQLHSPGKLAAKRARNGGVDDAWLRLAHEQLGLPSGWVFRGTCGACGKALVIRQAMQSREDYRDCPECEANVDLVRDESVGFWDC